MEFRHLAAFIAIAEELHFGRASARLHLTQPSLSAQLQKLEKSLGVQLVARNSHEVSLTAAGRQFESQARVVLQQMAKAQAIAKSAAAGPSHTLNIGYNFPASQVVLPSALAEMSCAHPEVMVSLWEMRTGPQMTALADGALDLAFVYGRPDSGDYSYRKVLDRIPLVAIVGSNHSWAGRTEVPFQELESQSCIMFDRMQCPAMYDAIFDAASSNKIALDVAQVADDPGATAHVVAVKPLVGFASLLRSTSLGMGALGATSVGVRLTGPVPEIDLFVVWRAVETNPAVASFLECLATVGPRGWDSVGQLAV